MNISPELPSTAKRNLLRVTLTLLAALGATSLSRACDMCGCNRNADATHQHSHEGDSHSHAAASTSAPLARNVTAAGGSSSIVQRFVVLGDTQGDNESGPREFMPELIQSINAHNASRIVLAGDLVGTGGNGTWNQWISNASQFNGGLENIIMTPGNHDQPSGSDALWRSKFSQTPGGQAWLPNSQTINGKTGFDQMDYYVDQGSTRFISVTTDTQAFGASNLANSSLEWMQEALRDADSNAAIENIFVYTHHPVTFDSTYGGSGNRLGTQAAMWQSLVSDSDKVRALFTGHWHLYQPGKPDPDNPDVWEVTSGTGGGGLEGRAVQNQHGFNVVDIHADGRIQSTFYGDEDGGTNGWDFNDIMDQFDIVNPNPDPAGLVAYYGFNTSGRNLDQAVTPLAKQNHGVYRGNSSSVEGGVLARALSLDGVGDYADGAAFGDYNLAINGDLTLSIHANYDTLAAGADENTLVSYGSALYDNNTPGSSELESEAVNIAYSLRLRDDKRLEMLWERENGTDIVLTSTTAAAVDAGNWHHYVVSRDIDANQLLFYVDGVQLGAPVAFTDGQQPTGGASGFLHVGSSLYGGGSFDGLLDELTIYNDVILPGQVFSGTLLGDLDGDSDVDLDDFLDEFRVRFGDVLASEGSAATLAEGDFDLDGDIDLFDFDAFQTYYFDANPGAAALSFNTNVPEPATWMLLVAALAMLWGCRCGAFTARRLCLVGVLALAANQANAANVLHDFQLSGNLDDSNAAGGTPSLAAGGGILFSNGYQFGPANGLSLSGWDPSGAGEDYSIEFYARFDVLGNGSYGKLVDFKNRGSDNGVYIRNLSDDHHPIFFNVNQSTPTANAITQGQFHHIVISRDEPGSDDVNLWLDGVQQWTFDDGSSNLAVADGPANILHLFVDDGGSENPSGYVDFIRVYDGGVSQAEVDAMFAGVPQYGLPEVEVNKVTGEISIHDNSSPEPIVMRGYQLSSASGSLDTVGWESWDSTGLDGNTWTEANPSSTQLAELNLTSNGAVSGNGSRSLGMAYGGGQDGPEDLLFEYLIPGSPFPIALPINYMQPTMTPGDLNFDTQINAADWFLYAAGLGSDLTGLSTLEAFAKGDVDGDFDNDFEDFLLFKEIYENANGPGSLAALLSAPEPATGLLITLAIALTTPARIGRS